MLQRGDIREIDDDLSLKMYDLLVDSLTAAGYEHYEISNFAKPHRCSRHNSSYRRYLLQTAQRHINDDTHQGIYICDSIMADLMYV